MKEDRKRLNALLYPPARWLLVLIAASVAGLILVAATELGTHPVAYALYALATYTLTVSCISAVQNGTTLYQRARALVYAHPLGNRYMTDVRFKVRVSLFGPLLINLAYSVFKLVTSIIFSSFWWGAFAVYYIMLAIMRYLLLHYMILGKEKQSLRLEYRCYQLCGLLFLALNVALSAIVYHMVQKNMSIVYPDGIILLAATYTFYNVTASIVDMVRYRKYRSPVMSASKAIRFAAALVSLLSLETAMLACYGDDPALFTLMTSWTGAGVCLIVLSISVYMILQAIVSLKKLKSSAA